MTWTMNYIEELEARIKEIEKRNIENAAKLGEAIGALKGILHNEISEELKEKINALLITHKDTFSATMNEKSDIFPNE
jgi:hypothetical protein